MPDPTHLRGLNPEQLDATVHFEGPLLVLAGAGSGKTRVLVERAVRLLTREEDPLSLAEILAITFTEKAAREMKERLGRIQEESNSKFQIPDSK